MSNDIITFDKKKLKILAEKGGEFVFKPEAEEELLKLIKVKELVEDLLSQAKEQIIEAGKEIDNGFKGIAGEHIRATYRPYGPRFEYESGKEETKPFLKEISYQRVDTDKVDRYIEKVGELPEGIHEKDRTWKLNIKVEDKNLLKEGK